MTVFTRGQGAWLKVEINNRKVTIVDVKVVVASIVE